MPALQPDGDGDNDFDLATAAAPHAHTDSDSNLATAAFPADDSSNLAIAALPAFREASDDSEEADENHDVATPRHRTLHRNECIVSVSSTEAHIGVPYDIPLDDVSAADHIKHKKDVAQKRPAVAGSEIQMKRPAAATLRQRPAASDSLLNHADTIEMSRHAAELCKSSEGPRPQPTIVVTRQCETMHLQVKDCSTRAVAVQVTDKQFAKFGDGAAAHAERAAHVLASLYKCGASQEDVQAVKNDGVLGVQCGVKCTRPMAALKK